MDVNDAAGDETAKLRREIMAAFNEPFRRPRTPLAYPIAALLVAVFMLLLPVLYCGFIGATAYAVYWHATHNTHLLETRFWRIALFLYATPIAVGIVAVFFMFKPLFSRSRSVEYRRTLEPQKQKLLWSFVELLCIKLNVAMPHHILVVAMPELCVSIDNGVFGLIRRRLALTVGLPVAAALTVRQFAGVLAHEMGHFSQGITMRLTYVVRRINHWFARLVYERDAWDDWLAEWAKEPDRFGAFLIAWLAIAFVAISRGILWVFMISASAASCLLLRQMEHQADLFEAQVSGSRFFAATSRRIHLIYEAGAAASYWLFQLRSQGARLPDDTTLLIESMCESLPHEARRKIFRKEKKRLAGWFDTHPSTSERILRAEASGYAGLPLGNQPASMLFENFGKLCRNATMDYYKSVFGRHVRRVELIPTPQLSGDQVADAAD